MRFSSRTLNALAEIPAYVLSPAVARWLAARLYGGCYRVFGRRSLEVTAAAVQLTLAEPARNARKIANACFAAKGAQRSNYRAMTNCAQWRVAQTNFGAPVYRALANAEAPLVILTMHQADYLAGLLSVLRLIPVEREIHIIKLAEWTQIEESAYHHFRQYGHTLVIHRLSEKPAKKIVRALKKQAILVTFVDVPREFGTTASVNMFDLPFQLTSGPLAMARLAAARVLPVCSNYSADGRCEVAAGTLIESQARSGQKPSVQHMAQQLADQIEANLNRFAAQWEMWPVIPNLLDQDAIAEHSANLSPSTLRRLALAGVTPKVTPGEAQKPSKVAG